MRVNENQEQETEPGDDIYHADWQPVPKTSRSNVHQRILAKWNSTPLTFVTHLLSPTYFSASQQCHYVHVVHISRIIFPSASHLLWTVFYHYSCHPCHHTWHHRSHLPHTYWSKSSEQKISLPLPCMPHLRHGVPSSVALAMLFQPS